MKPKGRSLLIPAAVLSFGIAVLHVMIIVIGAEGYLYFGAAGLARLAAQGSSLPAALTWGITAVFTVFGLYALSGAGVIRTLPFVHAGLITIGSVYTLRGLVVVMDVVRLTRGAGYPVRQTVFSAVSLGVGLLYLAGAFMRTSRSGAGGVHVVQ